MIDDRIRTAASNLRRDVAGPIPELHIPRTRRLRPVTAAAAVLGLSAAAGLLVLNNRRETPGTLEPSTTITTSPSTTDGTSAILSTTLAASTTTTSASAQTTIAPPRIQRVTQSELIGFIGTYTIHHETATVVLGSTGTVTYELDMSATQFCIRPTGGCEISGDGTPLPDQPQSFQSGGDSGGGKWTEYLIGPEGVDFRLFDRNGPACEMHQFSLQPYGNANVWACENTGDRPDLLDLEATKEGRSRVATIEEPNITNGPISDPVTTTGVRIGDSADVANATANPANPLQWLLVVSQRTGKVVGYVKRFELETPAFDGVVLVYDEVGSRIGELGDDWQVLSGA